MSKSRQYEPIGDGDRPLYPSDSDDDDASSSEANGGGNGVTHDLTKASRSVEVYDDGDVDGGDGGHRPVYPSDSDSDEGGGSPAGGGIGRLGYREAFQRLRADSDIEDYENRGGDNTTGGGVGGASPKEGARAGSKERRRSSTPATDSVTAEEGNGSKPNTPAGNKADGRPETSLSYADSPPLNPFRIDFDDEDEEELRDRDNGGLNVSHRSDRSYESYPSSASSFDDEELGIGRYQYEFTPGGGDPQRKRTRSTGSAAGMGGRAALLRTPLGGPDGESGHSSSSVSDTFVTPIRNAMDRIHLARAETRRKRAEHVLSMGDRALGARTKVYLCLSSWCDLTDRGIILILIVVVTFVVAFRALDAEENADARWWLLALGVPLLVFRVLWRPLYWLAWGRWAERRRREALELYDDLNGEHGTGGLRIPSAIDDDHGYVEGDGEGHFDARVEQEEDADEDDGIELTDAISPAAE